MKKKNMILKMSAAIALIMLSTAAFAQTRASRTAPGGIPKGQVPQFIVIGCDDNTNANAINWIADVLSNGTNLDGSERYMSFYVYTRGWDQARKNAVKRAYDLGHSIGNHTASHIKCVDGNRHQTRMSEQAIYNNMLEATNAMIGIGIPKAHQFGFRTPFLQYSDSTYSAMHRIGFVYDCSINAIYGPAGQGANFPYTLDIMPGQQPNAKGNVPIDNTNWWGQGSGVRPQGNPIREHKGLWVIPASAIEIDPADRPAIQDKLEGGASHYIPSGGWLVAGLDWNLWEEAKADSGQSVRALINTVKRTLAGNRAPLHLGFHSQYYFEGSYNDLTLEQRRGLFEEFVKQASQLEDVFFVTGDMVIAWMENPCTAANFRPENYLRKAVIPETTNVAATKAALAASFAGIQNGQINLQLANAGNYTVELYNSIGSLIQKVDMNATSGINATGLKTNGLSKGIFILNVRQDGASVLSQKIFIQ